MAGAQPASQVGISEALNTHWRPQRRWPRGDHPVNSLPLIQLRKSCAFEAQMKSPGVQLCRGSSRGSSTLSRGDPLLGHQIDSTGVVIVRLTDDVAAFA
jgi:hypothetical protein